MLLNEDKVQVEVWSWNDARLYTQQESQLTDDREQSFSCVYDIAKNKFKQLSDEQVPQVDFDRDRYGQYALRSDLKPYRKSASWEGFPEYRDLYVIDIPTGIRKKFAHKIKGSASVSPGGKYFYWFNAVDTVWQTYNTSNGQLNTLTDNRYIKLSQLRLCRCCWLVIFAG